MLDINKIYNDSNNMSMYTSGRLTYYEDTITKLIGGTHTYYIVEPNYDDYYYLVCYVNIEDYTLPGIRTMEECASYIWVRYNDLDSIEWKYNDIILQDAILVMNGEIQKDVIKDIEYNIPTKFYIHVDIYAKIAVYLKGEQRTIKEMFPYESGMYLFGTDEDISDIYFTHQSIIYKKQDLIKKDGEYYLAFLVVITETNSGLTIINDYSVSKLDKYYDLFEKDIFEDKTNVEVVKEKNYIRTRYKKLLPLDKFREGIINYDEQNA